MSAPLHYAPPLPWHRRGRTQRIVIRLLILSALACGGIWAFRFAQQLQFLYQQHQWLEFTMPPDQVVFEENLPGTSVLQKTRGYHKVELDNPSIPAAACDSYTRIAPVPDVGLCSLAFLHHMRCAGKSERLVWVALFPYNFAYNGPPPGPKAGTRPPELFASAHKPADLTLGSQLTICPNGESNEIDLDCQTCRVYSGQPDPSDESHFTIRCELDGKPNIIDGWLMPDDTVKLEPRHSLDH